MRMSPYVSVLLSVPFVFWKFEVEERFGLNTGGVGTAFPLVSPYFNHWCYRWKTLFMKISTCSQARALILRTCVFCGTTALKEVSTYVSVLPVVLCIYSLAKYRCMINDKTGLCGPFAKYCSYQKQMFTSVNLRFGSIPYNNQSSDETVSDQQYGNN